MCEHHHFRHVSMQETDNDNKPAKLQYVSPQLVKIGSFESITKMGAGGGERLDGSDHQRNVIVQLN